MVPLPDPTEGSYEVYMLQYCHKLTSKCFGCGGDLRKSEPNMLQELVVVSKEEHSYKDESGQIRKKVGNTYYHLNANCIRRKNKCFLPLLMRVLLQIKVNLSEQHKIILQDIGVAV